MDLTVALPLISPLLVTGMVVRRLSHGWPGSAYPHGQRPQVLVPPTANSTHQFGLRLSPADPPRRPLPAPETPCMPQDVLRKVSPRRGENPQAGSFSVLSFLIQRSYFLLTSHGCWEAKEVVLLLLGCRFEICVSFSSVVGRDR